MENPKWRPGHLSASFISFCFLLLELMWRLIRISLIFLHDFLRPKLVIKLFFVKLATSSFKQQVQLCLNTTSDFIRHQFEICFCLFVLSIMDFFNKNYPFSNQLSQLERRSFDWSLLVPIKIKKLAQAAITLVTAVGLRVLIESHFIS